MNSILSMDKFYVLCFGCAMAQLVKSRGEGAMLRDEHEASVPEHKAYRQVGQPRVLLHVGYGSSLRKIVEIERGDPREIKVGRLEVRGA